MSEMSSEGRIPEPKKQLTGELPEFGAYRPLSEGEKADPSHIVMQGDTARVSVRLYGVKPPRGEEGKTNL